MTLRYEDWPFRASERRSFELNQRWWDECYLPGALDGILQDEPKWRIIYGQPGSGRSTVLAALRRRAEECALLLDYPSLKWPGSRHTLRPEGNHLSQILARAALELSQALAKYPEKLDALTGISLEYLRWLIEKFSGARAYQVWLGSLPSKQHAALDTIEYKNLHTTDTEEMDVTGQIVELVWLCQQIGYAQVLVLMDIENNLTENQLKSMNGLFSWLDLMQHDGFNIVAAMPKALFEKAELVGVSKNWIQVHSLFWAPEELFEISLRHVRAATNRRIEEWKQLCQASVETGLQKMLTHKAHSATPRTAVALAKIIVAQAARDTIPLRKQSLDELRRAFFAEALPLRLEAGDTKRRVWRGDKFIYLDRQPYEVLRVLWNRRGKDPVPADDRDLLAVAHSKENIYVLIKRLRDELEPDPKKPVYILNERSIGYWLENLNLSDKVV